ncbi:MAG: dTDP-4-dehydrorhamnose 3,5-epimerase [Acidobacteriota bacterium]|nr:dTDP-4-dehydrorhamnose 3,5-epimerase [Acidobacteriota bacterium]
MEVRTYHIEGVRLIIPKVFRDHRGFFLESFNQQRFQEAGIPCDFVQDNHSRSVKGTLRGLHYQVNKAQDKLVRCTQGEVWDVAVDIRPDSPTYGQWVGEFLTAENMHQLFVPKGFAHGFQVLSETAEIQYKCTDFYSPPDDRGLLWNDPDLAIDWPGKDEPVLSAKDRENPTFKNIRLD